MLTLQTSPEAEADLVNIWLYISSDQPANADHFLDKLLATAQRLAEFPELGRERPELSNGLRSFPLGRYNLYYQTTEHALTLVRVLPSARDIGSVF